MDFTVSDMLGLEVLKGLTIVAGCQGLYKKVENITFLDAPDAVKWIRGQEFIITTFYLFKDTEKQLQLIDHLSEKNVSALGIKLNRFVYNLSPEVIKLADQRSLPLISIPNEKAWVDVINPVMAELLNRQLVILEKTNSIRRLFTEEVLEGRKLSSISKLLSELTNNSVTIIELVNKNVYNWPVTENHLSPEDLSILTNVKGKNKKTIKSTIDNSKGLIFPIEVEKRVEGFIVVWQKKELSSLDLASVEQATTLAALYIQQLKAVNEINQRFMDDFISHLMQAEFSSAYTREKAREMGWAMADKNRVVVVRTRGIDGDNWGRSYEIFNRFRGALKGYAERETLMGMEGNGTIIFILPGEKEADSGELSLLMATRAKLMQENPDIRNGLGIGNLRDNIESIPISYNEAHIACKVSMALNEVCTYKTLGSYSLLVELLQFDETEKYLQQMLYPILKFDRENKGNFFKTLDLFINQNGNYRETAKKLSVHHNTVRYRLETVERILGVDLKQPDTILNLMLALKLFNLKKS